MAAEPTKAIVVLPIPCQRGERNPTSVRIARRCGGERWHGLHPRFGIGGLDDDCVSRTLRAAHPAADALSHLDRLFGHPSIQSNPVDPRSCRVRHIQSGHGAGIHAHSTADAPLNKHLEAPVRRCDLRRCTLRLGVVDLHTLHLPRGINGRGRTVVPRAPGPRFVNRVLVVRLASAWPIIPDHRVRT